VPAKRLQNIFRVKHFQSIRGDDRLP